MLPKLLITQAKSPLGQSLLQILDQQLTASVDLIFLNDDHEQHAADASCALNLSMFNQDLQQSIAETRQLANFCAEKNIPLIHLSSYRVFSGDKKNAHNEKDVPQPSKEEDYQWLATEEAVVPLAKHIILRSSWLIGSKGQNLLTQLLSAFLDGAQVKVHRRLRGAPTAIDDLARVISAVIKQIQCGAENWGVMHYCSSDHCSEEEFAEQVLQYLIQYQLLTAEPSLQLVDGDEDEQMASAILGCRRLRDGFGIQGRSWRPNLLLLIKDWLATRSVQGVGN
jgi:dTDP-4-dehydrorhamnose reductase